MADEKSKSETSGPAPSMDLDRHEEKLADQRGGKPGPKNALEKVWSVLTGRDYLMGIWPNQADKIFTLMNPDDIIRRKGGFQEYKKMRHDDAVKAALYFKKILVYGRDWDIDPASDKALDEGVADFVTWALKRARFKRIIKEMLTALDFGFSVGEIIWEVAKYKGRPVFTIKEVKFRDPETFTIWTDQHGTIQKFVQFDFNFGAKEVEIPKAKVLHYAYQGELGNVYGTSDLRSIYKNWWAKGFLVNFWNVYLERLGAPTLLMKYPKGATAALQSVLKNVLKDLGNRAEILVPDGVAVNVLESTRAGQATYLEALTYHDAAIAKGILMPALLGFGEKQTRGADSQARLQLRTLFKVTDEIGQECSEIIEKMIIEPLVNYNFDVESYPELVWQSYGEYEATEIADVIRLLHNAGIIDPDQEDVNYVRSIVGLPTRDRKDDEDEVLRPNPAPMGSGAAPPTKPGSGGAQQGNETGKIGGTGGAQKGGAGNKGSGAAPKRLAEVVELVRQAAERLTAEDEDE